MLSSNNNLSFISSLNLDSSKETLKDSNLSNDQLDSNNLDEEEQTALFNEFLLYLNNNDNTNSKMNLNLDKDNDSNKDSDSKETTTSLNPIVNLESSTPSSNLNPLSFSSTNETSSNPSTDNFKDIKPLLGSMIPSLNNMETTTQPNVQFTNKDNYTTESSGDLNLEVNNNISNLNLNTNSNLNPNSMNINTKDNTIDLDESLKTSEPKNLQYNQENIITNNSLTLTNTNETNTNSYSKNQLYNQANIITNNTLPLTNTNETDTHSSNNPSSYEEASMYMNSFFQKAETSLDDKGLNTTNTDPMFSQLGLRTAPTLSMKSTNDIKEKLKQDYNTVADIVHNSSMNDLSRQIQEEYSQLLSTNTPTTESASTYNTNNPTLSTTTQSSDNNAYDYTNFLVNTSKNTSPTSTQYSNINSLDTPQEDSTVLDNSSNSNIKNNHTYNVRSNKYSPKLQFNSSKLDSTNNGYKNLDTSFNLKDSSDSVTKDTQDSSFTYLDTDLSSIKKEDTDLKVSSFRERVSSVAINKIVQESKILIDQGQSKANIDLSLYGLGKLSISINKNNKDMNLKIETDSNQVKQLLSENISSLKENLSQQNIEFKTIDIYNHSEKDWNFISSNNNLNSNTDSNNSNDSSHYNYNGSSSDGSNLSYNEGHKFFDSSNKYTDSGFESSSSSSSTEEKISDNSYSKRKIQHNGKIQVLI